MSEIFKKPIFTGCNLRVQIKLKDILFRINSKSLIAEKLISLKGLRIQSVGTETKHTLLHALCNSQKKQISRQKVFQAFKVQKLKQTKHPKFSPLIFYWIKNCVKSLKNIIPNFSWVGR